MAAQNELSKYPGLLDRVYDAVKSYYTNFTEQEDYARVDVQHKLSNKRDVESFCLHLINPEDKLRPIDTLMTYQPKEAVPQVDEKINKNVTQPIRETPPPPPVPESIPDNPIGIRPQGEVPPAPRPKQNQSPTAPKKSPIRRLEEAKQRVENNRIKFRTSRNRVIDLGLLRPTRSSSKPKGNGIFNFQIKNSGGRNFIWKNNDWERL
jgi:hypothetical protein